MSYLCAESTAILKTSHQLDPKINTEKTNQATREEKSLKEGGIIYDGILRDLLSVNQGERIFRKALCFSIQNYLFPNKNNKKLKL